ncbi:MAG: HAD-IA family hydrolase [Nanoarchaeota archaeon]|nr:HAD-IA family hydrolase [Nanoarchaeota archaeon]
MIKAFIFDVGGTLVKTDEAILEALTRALREHGIEFKDKEKVVNVFGQGQMKNVQTAVEVSYAGPDREEKIKQCYASFKTVFPLQVISYFQVIPYVLKGLDALKRKGMKLAVLTGFNQDETEFFLDKMRLRQYFDLILSAEDMVKHRPDPQGLLLAVEKLGLKKEECMYVGDTWVDILFARNAVVRVACVKTGAQDHSLLEKEKPDYLVDDFREMIKRGE